MGYWVLIFRSPSVGVRRSASPPARRSRSRRSRWVSSLSNTIEKYPPLPWTVALLWLWILFVICMDDEKSFRTRSRSGSREFGRKRGRREASRLHLFFIWVDFSLEVENIEKMLPHDVFQVSHEQQEKAWGQQRQSWCNILPSVKAFYLIIPFPDLSTVMIFQPSACLGVFGLSLYTTERWILWNNILYHSISFCAESLY